MGGGWGGGHSVPALAGGRERGVTLSRFWPGGEGRAVPYPGSGQGVGEEGYPVLVLAGGGGREVPCSGHGLGVCVGGGGVSILVLARGIPCPGPAQGVRWGRVSPSLPRKDMGPKAGVLPPLRKDLGLETREGTWDQGPWSTPPPPVDKLITLPSRRTTYARGKNCNLFYLLLA